TPPTGYEVGRLSRIPASPAGSQGKLIGLRQRADALPRDADAVLDGAREIALERGALTADDALDARARLLHIALELVARGRAAALEGALELLQATLGRGAGAVVVHQRARGPDDAIARLERRADVDQRGALDDRTALARGGAGGVGVRGGRAASLALRGRAGAA